MIEIHVKPGERGEIYSDGDNKVCSRSRHPIDSCLGIHLWYWYVYSIITPCWQTLLFGVGGGWFAK